MYKRYLEPYTQENPSKYITKKLKLCGNLKSSINQQHTVNENVSTNAERLGNDDGPVCDFDEVVDDGNTSCFDNDDNSYQQSENENNESADQSNADNISEEDLQSDDFFESINDEIIHPNLNCRTADAILMILEFFLHHHLTWVALEDLLQLFHVMLGYKSTLPKTKYLFKKMFEDNRQAIFHFYCRNCNLYIDTLENLKLKNALDEFGEYNINCLNCQHKFSFDKMNNGSFFIELPLRHQIHDKIVKNPEILEFDTTADSNGSIRDFYDGDLYKELRRKVGDGKLVTMTINTDGVRVFKSTAKSSLWPIQMFLNELPPEKLGNIILNGVWFGKDPDFALYFKHLINEFKNLDDNKIQVKVGNNTHDVIVRGFLMTTDSVARCKVMKMKQFNGSFGCTYCLHPGVRLNGAKNCKYPVSENVYESRTHANTIPLMMDSVQTGKSNFGIKGISPLIAIADYDLIRGTVIDYMHCVLLGVVFLLLELWFDSSNHFYKCHIPPQRAEAVIKNLMNIKCLKSFSHRPRSIDERNYWKANELRNWLLYYSVPCLKNILPDVYFRHFSLLSEAIFIFLKTKISTRDFKKAADNLEKFERKFQILYGEENMMYNVHLISHIPKCVKDCGPLWVYSNFNFESNNGTLAGHVNGTTDVQKQIIAKYYYNNVLESLKEENEAARNYINGIRSCKVKNSRKIGLITLFGKPQKQKLDPDEQLFLHKETISGYKKLFFQNDLFYSTAYKKCKQTDDTVVCLKNGSFGQITRIYEDGGIVYILVRRFAVQTVPFFPIHLKKVEFGAFDSVRADEISEKCVFINTSKEMYLSSLPNRVESD